MLIFPILSIVMTYIAINLFHISEKSRNDRALDMLYSISINTLIILTANEVLSLFHAINFVSLSVLWITVNFILLLIIAISVKKGNLSPKETIHLFIFPKTIFNFIDIIVLIVCCTAVYMAARTVPYNWDSMTYHLTRIAHWAQNGSIAHYVCNDISQISGPPLAEFVNLHVYILTGNSDYFVNLLQTFSYLIIIFLVYKISGKIGCNRLFSSLAALVFATSPIVFGEALSTQVDMYSALWLMVFVYMILHFTDINHRLQWNADMAVKLVLTGMSAGFSYLAKPSVCIAALIFTVWLFMICFRRKDKISIFVKSVITVAITALVITLPEMIRNFITFHSISSAETGSDFLVRSFDVRYLLVNLIQNIVFNLIPNDYLNIGDFVTRGVSKIEHLLYTGNEVPKSLQNFALVEFSMNHDFAINPTIVWLMVVAILCGAIIMIKKCLKRQSGTEPKLSWGYATASITSMLLFCSIARWYKFITSYEIGYLALLAPAVMLVFQYVFRHKKYLKYSFVGIIVLTGIITFGKSIQYHKTFLGSDTSRIEQYFAVRRIYDPYKKATDIIIEKQYKDIGFFCGADSYEYPLWKMLENSMGRFEHIAVKNATEIYDDESFLPECVIAVDRETDDTIQYHNVTYHSIFEESGVKLFER